MKAIRNTVIIFTLLMLISLIAFIVISNGIKITGDISTSYASEDLSGYSMALDRLRTIFDSGRDRLFKAVLIFWGAVLVSGYLFIFLVYRQLVKPVREMENFASEIAKGNLDVKLPIHKHNIFGNFTESFDIMREELRDSRKRENEAQKAKREMVAELSHDLKTPIATIGATCEVLDMKYRMKIKNGSADEIKESADMLEKVSYIKDKADVINELVDNVFHATEDEIDEIKITARETDSMVIEGFFESSRDYADIILENHIPQCLVMIDKLRMKQVIDNIIGNSIKYAGTAIHVSFSETEEPSGEDGTKNRYIKIKIKDDGPGVHEEDLPVIIGKFARGRNAEDKSGYGLGMYLVNFYMDRQRGGMNYYNDNGFVVELLVRKV